MTASQVLRSSVPDGIRLCNRLLRLATIVILTSFVLIIASTTVSTGSFVQAFAKVLYYLIVASALGSLVAWGMRYRLERGLEE